jgi:hypothetical protein
MIVNKEHTIIIMDLITIVSIIYLQLKKLAEIKENLKFIEQEEKILKSKHMIAIIVKKIVN